MKSRKAPLHAAGLHHLHLVALREHRLPDRGPEPARAHLHRRQELRLVADQEAGTSDPQERRSLRVAETVGSRLRRIREERGLSQRELSEPGVSYAYISRIEADARRQSEKALRALAPRLGVTPLYLETGSDDGVCPHCGRPKP
jgi:ribosome-binding protein aMBF1 (putative translation factor)